MRTVPVLVAGGGPVGMTLALELARLGVASVLVERNATTTRHPKMDITNARSMELFRRLGLDEALRAVAVPKDSNFDVSWVTTLTGHELHRFRYPSVREWSARIAACRDGALPAQPPMRVSQVEIEPVLARAVLAEPLIEARWGVGFEDLAQDAEGVTATLRRAEDGSTEMLRCRWLVGCDGGASMVRKALGIALEGQARVMQRFMTHFRSNAREVLQRWGIAWHYQSNRGTLIAQDDRDTWTLQTRWPDGVASEDVDPQALLRDFVGTDFPHEVLVANAWTPHLLVAQSYGAGRVFLAGDAAHQYIPTGGYGMNTGIGDACGLGWMLAAVERGLGGPRLLAAYEAERLPVGRRNREASGRHSEVRRQIGALYHPAVHESGAARAEAAACIATLGNAENESYGIELGYAYDASPVICAEAGVTIPCDPLRYEPTTAPGVRLPSFALLDGTPLHDHLGPWFTLICVGMPPSPSILDAAARRGMPLAVLRMEDGVAQMVLGRGLLLVRPDQHVAWRGTACDDARKAAAIVARVLGWERNA